MTILPFAKDYRSCKSPIQMLPEVIKNSVADALAYYLRSGKEKDGVGVWSGFDPILRVETQILGAISFQLRCVLSHLRQSSRHRLMRDFETGSKPDRNCSYESRADSYLWLVRDKPPWINQTRETWIYISIFTNGLFFWNKPGIKHFDTMLILLSNYHIIFYILIHDNQSWWYNMKHPCIEVMSILNTLDRQDIRARC